ncbi:alpha/beta-type small acid-soluble spore protein [Clostridium sp. SYSU_GA19001]|uniref:small, acid-soluble spore protein, alpha/beta type n=1 Tax=Clostridium caldaquaticum TaxID=2940653 RepID=UPI002076E91B|nr:small, acid-soluble spore protein, alpha/beta type [Clostridium caldaquaticum]MCM8711491.1 alpha/beta-type small acid-soluble spore protein [Clostridium caldaquaticum]
MPENHRLEQAIKDGVQLPKDNYWGNVPSKICGAYGGALGGNFVKNAVESFENKLADKDK